MVAAARDMFDQLTVLRLDTTQRLYGAGFAVDDSVATCVADGRIRRENAWIDMAAVAQQLA
jgi:predicted ester cyclase